jgi:hypothetical protein
VLIFNPGEVPLTHATTLDIVVDIVNPAVVRAILRPHPFKSDIAMVNPGVKALV